jgi:4-amino-4-deoxy-L-arabinose transferase-like glycosyltransferase
LVNKVSINSKRISLCIAIIGAAWAFFIHSVNIRFLEQQHSFKQEHGMVLTSDDASYLAPAENFACKGVWKDNTEGISSYIQRPPGMGIIHLVFYTISPQHHTTLHKIFNFLLHMLAIYVFGLAALELLNKKWAVFIQFIYAFLPCFWGYLFYYLTESITASLMVFLVYGYIKYHQNPSSRWLLLQAVISGIIILVRPQLIFFMMPFMYFLLHYIRGKHVKKGFVFLLACILGFGGFISWEIRSASIAHRFTAFHGIYDVTNNNQYRPVHQSFVELFKVWDYDNSRFHTMMLDVWDTTWAPTTTWTEERIQLHGCQGITKKEVEDLLVEYAVIVKEQRTFFEGKGIMQGETEKEKKLRLKIDDITRELKKKNWVLCNIVGPFRSAEFMIMKSQLNLAIFQHAYRGLWWMEALRYTCLLLILFSYLLAFSQLCNFKNKPAFLFAWSTLIYLAYLCFVHKINEERYLMPLLPILLLMAAERLQQLISTK